MTSENEEIKESKPFELMELKAICFICVTESILLSISEVGPDRKYKDEVQARAAIEDIIDRTIAVRWNSEDKR